MKKQFLLGLMAMLLPWTAWADAHQGQFTVTGIDETYEYAGVRNLTPAVKAYDADLTVETHYTISYTLDGEPVDEVKNVGKYEMTIAGAKGTLYENLTSTTIVFEVTKKELTSLALSSTGGTKVYGTDDKNVDLKTFVPKSGIDGLVSSTGDDEYENALKCLYLQRIDTEDEKEVANNTYKVLVRGYKKDAETGSNYYYVEGANIDAVDMKILPKEVTVTIDGDIKSTYDATVKTVTAKIDEEDIFVWNEVKDNVIVEFDEAVIGVNPENTTLKNADTYTLTAKLSGADADNYTLANEGEVTYTIERAVLTITKAENAELSKPYDGKIGLDGSKDLTKLYKFDNGDINEDVKELGLTMQLEATAATGMNVGSYLVHPNVTSNIGMGSDGNGYKTQTQLPNYEISYERGKLMFEITAKEVKYHFTSDGKNYDAKAVTLTDEDYTLVYDENDFAEGEDFEEGKAPKAKFAEVEGETPTVKDAGSYALTVANADAFANKNYDFVLEAGDNYNKYVISQATAGVNVKDQTLAFGKLEFDEDGELSEDIQKVWRSTSAYTDIALDKSIEGDDRTTDAGLIRSMLTFSIIREDAKKGESGEYDEAIQANIDATNENWSDAQKAILKNYKFDYNKAKLTISGFGADTPLVLDVEEDLAEETEAENKIAAKIAANVGATYKTVTIKNLRSLNNAGYGENKWYTLVLPFAVTVREISENFGYAIVNIPDGEKTNTNKNAIVFKLTMGEIPAHTPIAFKVDADEKRAKNPTLTFTDKKIVAIPETDDDWYADNLENKAIGTYAAKDIAGEYEFFLLPSTGNFYRASRWADSHEGQGMTITPFNIYFDFSANQTADARIILEEADGSTTAINAITGETITNNAEGWYSIDGMKLNAQPTQKGVYINNGKKVVIK